MGADANRRSDGRVVLLGQHLFLLGVPEHDLVEEEELGHPEEAEAGEVRRHDEQRGVGVRSRRWPRAAVDSARPAPVNTQNGMISRRRLTLPSTFHTQRLLRKNTGTALIITATTFDRVGSRSSSPTKITSSSCVNTTPNTDTIE